LIIDTSLLTLTTAYHQYEYIDASIGNILSQTFEKIFQEEIIRNRHGNLVLDGVWDRLYRRFMRRLAPVMFPRTSLRINTSTNKTSFSTTSPSHSSSPSRRLSNSFLLTSLNLQANKDRPTSSASSNSSTADDDDISESELQFLTAFGTYSSSNYYASFFFALSIISSLLLTLTCSIGLSFNESELIGRTTSNDKHFFDEPGWGATTCCNYDYGVNSVTSCSESYEETAFTITNSSSSHGGDVMYDLELLDFMN